MELNTILENQDSIDVEIHKLSYKQLKELAIQRNINPKLKKVQLVSALLANGAATICNKIEYTNNSATGRVTRARASIRRNVDNILSCSVTKNINIETYETSQTLQNECKTKTRGKRSKVKDNNYSSTISVKALSEITNVENSHECLKEESKSIGKEQEPKEQVTSSSNSENESTNCKEEVVLKKRGRKKKNVQISDKNIVSDIINKCSEEQNNVKGITIKLEEEISEPCKPKRGRKGKNVNASYPVEKNDPTSPSVNLYTEKSFQESVEENKCLRRSSRSNVDNSCVTISPAESIQADLPDQPTSTQLTKETYDCSTKVENMPVPAPIVRSSTFVLENKDGNQSEGLRRSNTFTISDEDGQSNEGLRRSNTFTILDSVSDSKIKKVTPVKNATKFTKSIGSRILSSSKKLSSLKSAGKPGQGSTLKKTITKNTATPGSLYKNKFGVSKKAPNFKAIHQKLFDNMESLPDNQKRKMEKAKALTQSPVPRCAMSFSSPKWELKKKNEIIIKQGMPQKKHTPIKNSPIVTKSKTPVVDNIHNSIPKSTSINRFGFNKKRINREVASSIVGTKIPPLNLDKRKNEDRALIQGVRMNKRFMLQMKMRQNKE